MGTLSVHPSSLSGLSTIQPGDSNLPGYNLAWCHETPKKAVLNCRESLSAGKRSWKPFKGWWDRGARFAARQLWSPGITALVRRFMERRPPGPLQARLKMIVGGESLIYEDPPASSENSLNCEGWVNSPPRSRRSNSRLGATSIYLAVRRKGNLQ
jgi:hypothetical protein